MFWTTKLFFLHWISIECGTVVFWFLLCRKRAKSGEIKEITEFWDSARDPHHTWRGWCQTRCGWRQTWRGWHRLFQIRRQRPDEGPMKEKSFGKAIKGHSLPQTGEEGIPPKFKPLKESLESRDQEKEKSIGEGLERKQEVKIERSSRIASILQAWSRFVLSFSLLFFFPPCMSRSYCF